MNLFSMIGIATTVVSFVAFVAIVGWAYSRRRAAAFAEAANAPFALPDDAGGEGEDKDKGKDGEPS